MADDVTSEVWTVASSGDFATDPTPFIGKVQRPAPGEKPDLILVAELLDVEGSRARADMLAKAPTLWRLLAEVAQSVELPRDLREVIELNLWLAAPGQRSRPKAKSDGTVDAPTAWTKVVDGASFP